MMVCRSLQREADVQARREELLRQREVGGRRVVFPDGGG